jgi:hypothetical protein
MHMKHFKIIGSLAAALLASTVLTGCPGGGGKGDPLGAILGGMFDQIQGTISSAKVDAEGAMVFGGSTLSYAIANAQADYDEQLNKTLDQLDAKSTKKFQELERVVNEFSQGLSTTATQLAAQGLEITNTLPLANTAPQVTSFKPQWIAGTGAGPVTITISGNFHSTLPEGLSPTLRIGGQDVKPAGAITQTLQFEVPSSALPSATADKVSTTTADLVVPYRSPVLKRQKTGTFRLLLVVLPKSVGTLSIEKTVRVPVTVTSEEKTWPPNGASCGVDAKSKDYDQLILCPVHPAPGSQLDQKSVRWEIVDARGSENSYWTVSLQQLDAYAAVYKLVAIDHPWYELDGKIFIRIKYRETTTHPEEQTQAPEPIAAPAWGTEVQAPISSDVVRWKLYWTRFDGQRFTYTGNAMDQSSYLTVAVDGPWVRISAHAPSAG